MVFSFSEAPYVFFLAKPKLQCSLAPLQAMLLLLLPTTPWWISRRTHRGSVHGRNRRNTSSPTATGLDDPKGGSFAVFLGIKGILHIYIYIYSCKYIYIRTYIIPDTNYPSNKGISEASSWNNGGPVVCSHETTCQNQYEREIQCQTIICMILIQYSMQMYEKHVDVCIGCTKWLVRNMRIILHPTSIHLVSPMQQVSVEELRPILSSGG